MKEDAYVLLRPFMVDELDLKGAELIIFGIIFGFSAQDHEFTGSVEYLMEWTKGSRSHTLASLKSLVQKGYIAKKERWVKSQKYCSYSVPDEIREKQIVLSENQTSLSENQKTLSENQTSVVRKSDPIIKNNNIKDNNKELIEDILSYFNSVTGKSMRATDDVCKKINGRLKEGFTVDDFKKVIDIKNAQWKNDPQMKKFIRPSTLFAPSHFQEYLNEDEKKELGKVWR